MVYDPTKTTDEKLRDSLKGEPQHLVAEETSQAAVADEKSKQSIFSTEAALAGGPANLTLHNMTEDDTNTSTSGTHGNLSPAQKAEAQKKEERKTHATIMAAAREASIESDNAPQGLTSSDERTVKFWVGHAETKASYEDFIKDKVVISVTTPYMLANFDFANMSHLPTTEYAVYQKDGQYVFQDSLGMIRTITDPEEIANLEQQMSSGNSVLGDFANLPKEETDRVKSDKNAGCRAPLHDSLIRPILPVTTDTHDFVLNDSFGSVASPAVSTEPATRLGAFIANGQTMTGDNSFIHQQSTLAAEVETPALKLNNDQFGE